MKDRTFFIIVALEIVATAGLAGGLILGTAVYLSRPAAPAPPTQALNLAALPTNTLPFTSTITTLPPEPTATPFSTKAASALTNTSEAGNPVPSATLPTANAGSPTNAPSASPTAPPAATAGLPDAPSPTALPTTITLQPANTPQPSATNVPDGPHVETGSLALTVMGVSKQGDEWPVQLVVDVVLENVNREQVHYDYSYFTLVDSTGFSYDAAVAAPEPGLLEGDLARGSQVRGNVAFEIYPEADGLWLIYGDYELIQVNLGQ